ncbi:MAG: methyltransferase [Bdellovibrionia bacterium]
MKAGDWTFSKFESSSDKAASIQEFLSGLRSPDYHFSGEYVIVRRNGELVSIVMAATYLDGQGTSFQSLAISEKWAAEFQNQYSPERGYFIPVNDVLVPSLEKLTGVVKPTVNHFRGVRVAQYPVPEYGKETQFRQESYIQFGKSYDGPHLTANPYSARLLAEVSRFVRLNPGKQRVLVVGSGIGYEAVHLLKICSSCRVDVSEIDAAALKNTELNIDAHGLRGRSKSFLSDLFNDISGNYDLIVFAPPRPVTENFLNRTKPKNVQEEVWQEHVDKIKTDFGQYDYNGRLLNRTVDAYGAHLNPDGALIIMSDAQEIQNAAAGKSQVKQLYRGGYWGGENQSQEGRYGIFLLRP